MSLLQLRHYIIWVEAEQLCGQLGAAGRHRSVRQEDLLHMTMPLVASNGCVTYTTSTQCLATCVAMATGGQCAVPCAPRASNAA